MSRVDVVIPGSSRSHSQARKPPSPLIEGAIAAGGAVESISPVHYFRCHSGLHITHIKISPTTICTLVHYESNKTAIEVDSRIQLIPLVATGTLLFGIAYVGGMGIDALGRAGDHVVDVDFAEGLLTGRKSTQSR